MVDVRCCCGVAQRQSTERSAVILEYEEVCQGCVWQITNYWSTRETTTNIDGHRFREKLLYLQYL